MNPESLQGHQEPLQRCKIAKDETVQSSKLARRSKLDEMISSTGRIQRKVIRKEVLTDEDAVSIGTQSTVSCTDRHEDEDHENLRDQGHEIYHDDLVTILDEDSTIVSMHGILPPQDTKDVDTLASQKFGLRCCSVSFRPRTELDITHHTPRYSVPRRYYDDLDMTHHDTSVNSIDTENHTSSYYRQIQHEERSRKQWRRHHSAPP